MKKTNEGVDETYKALLASIMMFNPHRLHAFEQAYLGYCMNKNSRFPVARRRRLGINPAHSYNDSLYIYININ